MSQKTAIALVLICLGALAVGVCSPEGEEPEPVSLTVRAIGNGLTEVTNDKEWIVTLSRFRLAVADLEFTIEGETHASRASSLSELLIPSASAHPGHSAGGDVVGALGGEFLLDLVDATQKLGKAELLPDAYTGMNLHFRTAGASDDLDTDDPLYGHTAYLEGTAEKEDTTIDFTAVLAVDDGTEMIGGPFEATIGSDTKGTLNLQVLTLDPYENDTMFDGLDFGELDEDEDGELEILPGSAAHNILAKTVIRHDHYAVTLKKE
jgi:hypothetical protein